MEEKEPLVSIIILNYNAGKLLKNCVKSIFDSDYKNLEVIVVDNISNDNSHHLCKKEFQQIRLIENKEKKLLLQILLLQDPFHELKELLLY